MEGEETENISKFEEIKNELLKAKSTDEKVQIIEQLASAISDISGNDIFICESIIMINIFPKLLIFVSPCVSLYKKTVMKNRI